MNDEWIIDGVIRPRGAKAHLNGGIFDVPCGGHKPDKKGEISKPSVYIVDARGPEHTAGLTVFVYVKNEGSCPFTVHLLNSAGADVVSSPVDPKNSSGLIVRSGVASVELRCGGTATDGRCKGSYDVWIG